jgi:hypothetical protein
MMISYKALTGVEIQHWQGNIYFWMPWGVYSLSAEALHRHGRFHGRREVTFWLHDLENGYTSTYTESFPESFDDWELINRYISGTGSCDCERGRMIYGDEVRYSCNKRDNRFILQKMVIKGEKLNCIITYRGYM